MNKQLSPNLHLKKARLARGWSQASLAEQIGTDPRVIRRWESGGPISPHSIAKLTELFGLSAEELGLLTPFPQTEEPQQVLTEEDVHPLAIASFTHPPDPNRDRLLKRVHTIWINGILERSLHSIVRIELGLQDRPDLVANPWQLIVQETNQQPRPFDPTMTVMRAYEEADGKLLIVGEPGAGKTTLLLELARDLLHHAQNDHTQPIPVVFHLSSWVAKRTPFASWIGDELCHSYRVPRRVAEAWLQDEQLLLLLDGLDEVAQEYREDCIDTINAYQQEHALVPIVVCTRTHEYLSLSSRIHLQTALMIQALTEEQIEVSITRGGEALHALKKAFHQNRQLLVMMSTPLILSLFVITYKGATTEEILNNTSHEQVFAAYIQHMLRRRGKHFLYSKKQTIHWLSWLACQLNQRSQTLFYIEFLQPSWLPTAHLATWYYLCSDGVLGMLFGITICGLLGVLIGGTTNLLDMLPFLPPEGPDNGLFFGSLLGLILGLIGGLIVGTYRQQKAVPITLKEKLTWSWPMMIQHLIQCMLIGLITGVSFTHAIAWILTWQLFPPGLTIAFTYEIIGMLAGASIYFLSFIKGDKRSSSTSTYFIQPFQKIWIGILAGMSVGFFTDLLSGGFGGPIQRLLPLLFHGYFLTDNGTVLIGLLSGIIGGIDFGTLNGFVNTIMAEHERLKPNYGVKQSARNSFAFATICSITSFIIFLPVSGINHKLIIGLLLSLSMGLFLALLNGGTSCIRHWILRLFLKGNGLMPLDYIYFLDYSTERIFLRKVGGGYMFIHPLLRDYFASLTSSPSDNSDF